MNNIGVGITLTATDLASGVIKRVRNGFAQTRDELGRFQSRWTGAYKAFGAGVATFTAGVGALGALGYVANQIAPFEKALASLSAVSGATAEQMRLLEQAAMDAGLTTKFTPTQAAEALTDLASAGYNVDQSIKLLIPTLNLATASLGQLGASEAAGVASSALKAFGLEADDAGVVVDKLTKTMNLFAVQAKDLPLGIANSVRGATAMNQSLDETLVTFGLIRNIMPRTESAATAVSTAMERMVKPETQQALKRLGVNVTTADGRFRDFLDVLVEMQPQLDKMSDSKSAAFLQETFGTEALGGITAVSKQLQSGIADASGAVLKGAAAVAYLRREMTASGGEAARFGEKMANTLPGQFELLKASGQSLVVELGKPLAEAFKPVVSGIRDGVQAIVSYLRKLSPETKASIAKFALVLATIVTSVGAFVASAAGAAILLASLKALGVGVAAIAAAFAPVIALVGAATLAFVGLKSAADQNVGGLGDKLAGGLKKAALAFEAFGQAFSQGGFSGTVRDELNQAENAGLKQFVVNTYSFVMRLQHMWESMRQSFKDSIKELQPVFAAFEASMNALGAALGIPEANDPTDNAARWERWGKIGTKAGALVAATFGGLMTVMSGAIGIAAGFIGTFDGWDAIGSALSSNFRQVTAALDDLSRSFGGAGVTAGSVGRAVGRIASAIMGSLASAIRYAGNLMSGLVEIFSGGFKQIKGIFTGDWALVWEGVQQVFMGVIKILASTMLTLVEQIAAAVDAIGALAGKDLGARKTVAGWREGVDGLFDMTGVAAENQRNAAGPQMTENNLPDRDPVKPADQNPFASLAMANQVRQESGLRGDDLTAAVREAAAAAPPGVTNATMIVDGEVLGKISIKHQRGAAIDAGVPVGLEE